MTVFAQACCSYKTLLLISFPQFESLELLSASQVAQLTLTSGALHNVDLIRLILDRLEGGSAFQEIGEFLTALLSTPQVRSHQERGGREPRLIFCVAKDPPSVFLFAAVFDGNVALCLFALSSRPWTSILR